MTLKSDEVEIILILFLLILILILGSLLIQTVQTIDYRLWGFCKWKYRTQSFQSLPVVSKLFCSLNVTSQGSLGSLGPRGPKPGPAPPPPCMMSVVLGGPGQTAMGDIRETEPLTTSPHNTSRQTYPGDYWVSRSTVSFFPTSDLCFCWLILFCNNLESLQNYFPADKFLLSPPPFKFKRTDKIVSLF